MFSQKRKTMPHASTTERTDISLQLINTIAAALDYNIAVYSPTRRGGALPGMLHPLSLTGQV